MIGGRDESSFSLSYRNPYQMRYMTIRAYRAWPQGMPLVGNVAYRANRLLDYYDAIN